MLKIAIETGYVDKHDKVDRYWVRYFMQNFFLKHDIELVRVSINAFNAKKWCFSEYNIFDKQWKNICISKAYTPDIIRIRHWWAVKYKYEKLAWFLITPSEKMSIIGRDKFEQYTFIKEYQPHTSLLRPFLNKKTVQKQFKGKIVIKPIRWNGWKGITLTTPSKLMKDKERYYWQEALYIVQQFKDFSKWFPWLISGNHDIRLMFAGKKIIEVSCRMPKKWNFKSNISSWGDIIAIKKTKLPKELLSLAKKIYKKLNLKDQEIFSMNFAYCLNEKRQYLIEINSAPWTRTSWYRDQKILTSICIWLIKFFKDMHKNQK